MAPRLVVIFCALLAAASGALLTGAERRFLRAHAGRLDSAKLLKRAIVSDVEGCAGEVTAMLEAHELIRCKFPAAKKKAQAKELAERVGGIVGAEVAQVIGHTALLYKQTPKKLIRFGPAVGEGSGVAEAPGARSVGPEEEQ